MGTTSSREHFWDGLRAFLMLLGIPYHVALSYQPGQDFIVHSGEGVRGLPELAAVLHLFRMPAFFVIAGYFAFLLLARREPMEWLKGRFMRLGVPFVTALLILVPAMNFVCELSNLPFPQAVASWRNNLATSGGYWVRHLWFIVVLLYFCTASAWLVSRFPAARMGQVHAGADTWAARHFLLALLIAATAIGTWEALAIEGFYAAGLATMVPQQVLRLDEMLMFAPWFALGAVLVRARSTLERTCRFSLPVALLAVSTTTAWMLLHQDMSPMAERFLGSFAALATTQVLIAGARTLLNRPMRLVRRLTDASFVIYLFHLPLIALLVWLAQPLGFSPLVKAIGVSVLCFGLSYAIWLGIGRVRSMTLLFEGITMPRRAEPALAL